jgi:cysteinyl-tRNA synthetase
LQVYDTLAGKKTEFEPGKEVRMFLCGPTVYDYSHAGHARMLLFYDLAARYFRFSGAKVRAVVNITDIDPKIFARARKEGKSPREIADYYISELLRDAGALGIDGFAFARVSDYVQTAQDLTKHLLAGGKAYFAGGNVYLDAKGAGFGRLSKMTDEELADCRLDIASGKKAPYDVLLWNAAEHFGVSFSDKTLGSGVPWWHMQDTSVAMAAFGGAYYMHGGADELVYPHHESRLAQLRALTGKTPVRLWTHVGLVYSKGKKMSKSLGNTVAIRELVRDWGTNAVRLYMYSTHYRRRLDFSKKGLEKCAGLDGMIAGALQGQKKTRHLAKFLQALDNDFDTPTAIRVMTEAAKTKSADLRVMAGILGLRH